jgi:hypothetical protein
MRHQVKENRTGSMLRIELKRAMSGLRKVGDPAQT